MFFRSALACLLLALVAGMSARRAYVVSFVRYDDDRTSELVYVQTRRDVNRLVARIEDFARSRPEGRDLPIEILSPDYLPLNWYLRDFTDVSYFGKVTESPGAPVVIARSDAADSQGTGIHESARRPRGCVGAVWRAGATPSEIVYLSPVLRRAPRRHDSNLDGSPRFSGLRRGRGQVRRLRRRHDA